MSFALQAKNLKKKYDGVSVVDDISFEIQPGECVGLLGPNGAGKSTTIKMMYGHVLPTSGELFILGLNIQTEMQQIRSRIGIVPQDDSLDTDFSAIENLTLFAKYFGLDEDKALEQAEQLLSEMRLTEFKHKSVEQLSGGMKRRLAIARGLIHQPHMLILDEPTTGLDPQARLWIWNYFERLKSQKMTMILTTHYMEEAEKLCDRIIIIDHGKILDSGSAKELIKKHIGQEVVEIHSLDEKTYLKNKIENQKLKYQEYENALFVFFENHEDKNKFIQQLENTHYYTRASNLNDVFLKLAGYQIRDEKI